MSKRRRTEEDSTKDLDSIRVKHFKRPSREGPSNMANFMKPSGEGCSGEAEIKEEAEFRVYFKGVVGDEKINNEGLVLGGIGVVISDFRGSWIVNIKKPLTGTSLSRQEADIKALIAGLKVALSLELSNVQFFCDSYAIFQWIITEGPTSKKQNIADLVREVQRLQRKFTLCQPIQTARNDVNYAFKLAQEALFSQIIGMSGGKEVCDLCKQVTDSKKMIAVDGCLHRYCEYCLRKYVEEKLLEVNVPKCPVEYCQSYVSVGSCQRLLTPKINELLKERIKEASIPFAERVYCPYPQCSEPMSKHELSQHVNILKVLPRREISLYPEHAASYGLSGARKCMKCHGQFCINCTIQWHYGLACDNYKLLNPNSPKEDLALMALARRKKWRQCEMCYQMIELVSDRDNCADVTCRCGYEFCYNCGDEWLEWDGRIHEEKMCAGQVPR